MQPRAGFLMAGGSLQNTCTIMSNKVSLPHSYYKFDPLQVQPTITESLNTLTLLNAGPISPNTRNPHLYTNALWQQTKPLTTICAHLLPIRHHKVTTTKKHKKLKPTFHSKRNTNLSH